MSRFELLHNGRVLALFDSAEELGKVVMELASNKQWTWEKVE